MPDLWELDNGFDPTFDDAQQDADMDGVSNYDEYLSGTDPQAGSTEPGFETGIFAPWYWIHGGDSSWTIDTENLSTGTYAIKSGAISDGQTSSVETRVNTLDSTMFFLVSVSSEFSSDQLNFYIDDVLQESWSGEEAFQAAYYPITEGVHTFRWEYAKDGSGASGADAAWIYDIYIPTLLDEDTDADDISDTWEYAYFGTLGHDMSLDTDGDGVIDLDEYANGTDPIQ